MQPGDDIKGQAINTPAPEPSGAGERVRKRDLSSLVGTWQEDPEFDEAIADQDKVDEELWR